MTTTTPATTITTPPTAATSGPGAASGASILPADDPRAVFGRAVALATDVIATVRPDQLGAPTPCAEYDVRALLGHLVMVLDRVAAVGRGEDAFTGWAPRAQPDDGWGAAWEAAAQGAEAAWADDAVLSRIITVPWTTLPGAQMLDAYTSEVTVHTWDLAHATGQQPAWDPSVVAVADASMRALLPDARRAAFIPFADAVAVPGDAAPIERLVAWNGRSPAGD